jgi:hypothetical protein
VSLLRLTNEGSESADRWHKLLEESFGRHSGLGTTPGQDIFEYFLREFVLKSSDLQEPLEKFLTTAFELANREKKAQADKKWKEIEQRDNDAMDVS